MKPWLEGEGIEGCRKRPQALGTYKGGKSWEGGFTDNRMHSLHTPASNHQE